MKLSREELDFLENISLVSGQSKEVIKDVFLSTLFAITITILTDEYQSPIRKENNYDSKTSSFIIPYIGKLCLEYKKKLTLEGMSSDINSTFSLSSFLKKEINSILNLEKPPSIDNFKRRILEKYQEDLEIIDKVNYI